MFIERDGKKIELTEQELVDAYFEQEHNYDKTDVLGLFGEYEDDDLQEKFGITRDQVTDELVSDIATEMRHNMDKYGLDKENALDEAVKTKIRDYAPYTPGEYIPITLIRNRPSEREQWANTIYLRIGYEPNRSVMPVPVSLEQQLRTRISQYMMTTAGWESNQRSCLDYNWGDFVNDMPLEKFGLVWEPPRGAKIHPAVTMSVDQDEHLAPTEAHGLMMLYKNCEYERTARMAWCNVDLQTGELTLAENEPILDDTTLKETVRGVVTFPFSTDPDGAFSTFVLDPEEDYMRLK